VTGTEGYPGHPPEYDAPDASEWEGARLSEICDVWGIDPPWDALRCHNKYGEDGSTVSVLLPNGERLIVPDDLHKIRALPDDEPVAAWIVHGIAWDGSDWEYSQYVKRTADVGQACQDFAAALADHRAIQDEIDANEPPAKPKTPSMGECNGDGAAWLLDMERDPYDVPCPGCPQCEDRGH
jgi:hypothetical protein